MSKIYSLFVFCILSLSFAVAQSPLRITDYNAIGWYVYQGTFKLSPKWDLYTEYQWRRDHLGLSWQQSQFRGAVQYNFHKQVSGAVGYSFINTYVYGDYPIASKGYPFPEHRVYQQLILKNPIGRFDISHRLRMEQRWVGQMNAITDTTTRGVAEWRYTNRARYMMRVNVPLKGNTLDDKEIYAAAYDEIFFSFGQKVKMNIWDQNRFAALIGYKLNSNFRVEGGFFSQILQQGGLVKQDGVDKAVIQYNDGIIATAILNFDTTKWGAKKE